MVRVLHCAWCNLNCNKVTWYIMVPIPVYFLASRFLFWISYILARISILDAISFLMKVFNSSKPCRKERMHQQYLNFEFTLHCVARWNTLNTHTISKSVVLYLWCWINHSLVSTLVSLETQNGCGTHAKNFDYTNITTVSAKSNWLNPCSKISRTTNDIHL